MSLWLRIYSGDVLKETEITDRKTVSAGAGEGDDIQIGSMGTCPEELSTLAAMSWLSKAVFSSSSMLVWVVIRFVT